MILQVAQRHVGFTLIELILVSVVLSILLAAAAPRFQQTAQRLRAEQSAFECAQLLRMAHERAIAEGETLCGSGIPKAVTSSSTA